VDRLTRDESPRTPQTFAEAARGISLWDAAALQRALSRTRAAARPNGALGWDALNKRLIAYAVEQPTGPDAADSQPTWRVVRVAADVADDRGGTMERTDPDDPAGGLLASVLVHDQAETYYVVTDSTDRVAAPELRSFGARVAHAWHFQNPRLLSDALSGPQRRIVFRRDVRDRLGTLYPFFDQGGQVTPVAWHDSLYWAVHLYATSTWYPLSEAMPLGVRNVHYLRHAAVAVINAQTGRTTAIGDPSPDPVTSSWMHRFPSLFVEPSGFDRDLTRRLPPAYDGTLVAARAFARVGVRGEYLPTSHLPRMTGGDTLFNASPNPPYLDFSSGLTAIAFPVLDASDRLRGTVTSDGGAEYHPQWHPLDSVGPRWPAIVDSLQRMGDSLRAFIRDTRLLQGPVRVVPTAEGVVAVETHYTTRPDGTPQELYISVLRRNGVLTGMTIPSAMGLPAPLAAQAPLTPEEFRSRVEALYGAMREALRRGDWGTFGEAYEALGRLLRAETKR
jgi:hypothetical protein